MHMLEGQGAVARLTIAPLFLVAGFFHILLPGAFMSLMPQSVPSPQMVVILTGIAEIAGVVGLFIPQTRRWAGAALALYALCVYPVNIAHAVRDLSSGTGLGWVYHYPRLFAQPLICWWALAAGGFRLRRGA